MVIYDTPEDIWKKIKGYFGNFENCEKFRKILKFFENFGKKLKILEKN